jgi:hypothetical protein
MKTRTRPAPGPGRGHLSPAGQAKRFATARRERQFCLDAMHNWDTGGWGGPAKGAHPPKPRTLPQVTFVHPDDLDDIAEREAVARVQCEVFRAKGRAFDARRARLLAYREAVLFGGPRGQPVFIRRYSPGQEKPKR